MTQFHPPVKTESKKGQSDTGAGEAKKGQKPSSKTIVDKKPGSLWPSQSIDSSVTDQLMRGQHKSRFNIILLIAVDLALLLAFSAWFFYFR